MVNQKKYLCFFDDGSEQQMNINACCVLGEAQGDSVELRNAQARDVQEVGEL